ncbi:MAG: FAD-binding oxidoreductase [Armatimonadetes bacterium]|nr:FAD-binding oxidoreductase [Armatimonadota bacterium]
MNSIDNQLVRRLSGFGGVFPSDGYVIQPYGWDGLPEIFEVALHEGRRVALRGSGRSYGDAATGREAIVLDLSEVDKSLEIFEDQGVARCGPSLTIEELWKQTLPRGFWPPVVTGTSKITLGGAVAMNVHGKNHAQAGSFGDHVQSLDWISPNGWFRKITPNHPEFTGLVSSAGGLGLATSIDLKLKRIHSGDVEVRAQPTRGWREILSELDAGIQGSDYAVGWLNMAEDPGGLLHFASYCEEDSPATLSLEHQSLPSRVLGVPVETISKLLSTVTQTFGPNPINWAKDKSARFNHMVNPGSFVQSLVAFSFLLDYVPGWQRAYGSNGFVQLQPFVPRESAEDVFTEIAAIATSAKRRPYLTVLKRHRPDNFLLSPNLDGYSLAMDIPFQTPNDHVVRKLCEDVADLVIAKGGRLYPAKDSFLSGDQAKTMLGPRFDRFQSLKSTYDPQGLMTSDLLERWGLISVAG